MCCKAPHVAGGPGHRGGVGAHEGSDHIVDKLAHHQRAGDVTAKLLLVKTRHEQGRDQDDRGRPQVGGDHLAARHVFRQPGLQGVDRGIKDVGERRRAQAWIQKALRQTYGEHVAKPHRLGRSQGENEIGGIVGDRLIEPFVTGSLGVQARAPPAQALGKNGFNGMGAIAKIVAKGRNRDLRCRSQLPQTGPPAIATDHVEGHFREQFSPLGLVVRVAGTLGSGQNCDPRRAKTPGSRRGRITYIA